MKLLFALLFVSAFVAASEAKLTCDLCLKVVGFLETEFNENGGVIEKDANKICDKITFQNQFLDPICHNLIDGQIEEIEKLLKEGKDAQHICNSIKFC
uniref:Saposin B-type domain-containing protein n=1 Tax=Steinernema glaseri TaxID=37863 RepID=A0A1I7ZE96_9BILA